MFLSKCYALLKRLLKQGFFYFVLFVVFLVIMADNYSTAQKEVDLIVVAEQKHAPFEALSKTDSLIEYALSLEGIPYHYAGNSLKGFDCSGFTYYVFNQFNISIPRASYLQYDTGQPIDTDEIKKGDLLFFAGTQSRAVGHVGIVVEEKGADSKFVHSSSGGGGRGVTVDSLSQPHYQARFLGAKRIEII